jgi:hypothetical protein
MIPIKKHCDVNVDNVSIFERSANNGEEVLVDVFWCLYTNLLIRDSVDKNIVDT